MKILITGGTGFAAKHLIKKLSDEGHYVWSTIRNKDNNNETFLYMDLLDKDSIKNIFINNKFDAVFHLAAITHIPTCIKNPLLAFNTNALGTIYLCDAIQEFNPESFFMNCSTGSVYGNFTGDITEECQISPIEPYGVSKACAELYIIERAKNGYIQAFSTRTFSHTGPGRGKEFSISSDAIQIARIIKKKQDPIIFVGNIEAKRVIADVRDVVEAYHMLMSEFMNGYINSGDIFNVSGDNLYSIKDCLEIMISLFGLSGHVETRKDEGLFRSIDVEVQVPNNKKLKKVLSWEPKIKIEKTLQDLVEYWLERL